MSFSAKLLIYESVLRGLIYLLIEKNLSLVRYVQARYNSAGKELFRDINIWSAPMSMYLVTDVLDKY